MIERQYVVVEMAHGDAYDSEELSIVSGPFPAKDAALAFIAAQPKRDWVSRRYAAPLFAPGEQPGDGEDMAEYVWA